MTRIVAAVLLALVALPALAFDPPPPPPRDPPRLVVAVPPRPRPVWVEIAPAGLRVLDALAPPGNGFCAYAEDYAWCEVRGPAEIVVLYAPRAEGCAAGVALKYDKRPAGWQPLAPCRMALPALVVP